ncbi:MAG: DUF4197 domain-containing protein [Paludibacteraceae bacterium]|nr:DUF4197 domain-containing protein [Candidatus Physcocola equi]MCQ2234366.1 DUF4197 domain-containing protein [Paludibacteraceae bacterium]
MDILKNIGAMINTAQNVLNSDAAKQVMSAINQGSGNAGGIDIASGLKAALQVGIETAAKNLGAENGYLADAAVKIGLPKEAVTTFGAVQSLASNPAFNQVLNATGVSIPSSDTIVTLFNRAAENAAPKSVGTFVDAITGMSIADAKNILFGEDNAATTYLRDNTYTQLQSTFNPSITDSLNTIKVANFTPVQAWSAFATYNNKLVELLDSPMVKGALEIAKMTGVLKEEHIASLGSIDLVNGNLSDYITGKALDGLFLKVSDKEQDIRHNASSRVSDVLQSVFGMLDK